MPERAGAPRRLLVVQYAGDYAETWHRLAAGGAETYLAQAYGDRAIAGLAGDGTAVAVLVATTATPYREALTPWLSAVGLGPADASTESRIVEFATAFRPTHVLLRAPFVRVMRWACDHGARVLLTLADSFQGGLRRWLSSRRMVRLMNAEPVDWVSNHGTAASGALVRMGVDPAKVIPWDWPHHHSPAQWGAKTLAPGQSRFTAIYVGARVALKGVGDALQAIASLAGQGLDIRLDVVGEGEDFNELTERLGLTARVRFLGRLSNAEIIPAMRQADVVLVPSRKAYPEGFPLTLYEALCSRTPIVASDHPMFVPKLVPDRGAVLFRAGDAVALASAIERLLRSPALYDALSLNALATWQGLQVPTKWGDLVSAWFEDTATSREWLSRHTWAAMRYV